MDKVKLLIIEDDENIRSQLKWSLALDYEVLIAENRPDALEIMRTRRPGLALLDLGLPPKPNSVDEGFSTLAGLLAANPFTKIIIMTGQQEEEHAVRGIAQGACDYFSKPIQIGDLKVVLKRAEHVFHLEEESRKLLERGSDVSFESMLGASQPMKKVFKTIRKVASTDVSVLITGESGTGKELTGLALHRLSSRSEGPFVAINCSAIPDTLLESELFGFEKGAFTGAEKQKKGRIELAQGGTLFLDEIGDLSTSLQVKLLRFLEERKLVRIGGRDNISLDVRIISATNRDLQTAVEQARFRRDLYFRLAVVTIPMPPLRERGDDILLLARAFLKRYVEATNRNINDFTPQALDSLATYNWPGNVRELQNRINRAVIMAEGKKLTPIDLELDTSFSKYSGQTLKEARESLERDLIQRALTRNTGNITRAAAELDISRPALYELMKKLSITKSRT